MIGSLSIQSIPCSPHVSDCLRRTVLIHKTTRWLLSHTNPSTNTTHGKPWGQWDDRKQSEFSSSIILPS